jgi:hypothetical protein
MLHTYLHLHVALTSFYLKLTLYICKGKCKGKVHPRTGQESPEGEWKYSPTLSLTRS